MAQCLPKKEHSSIRESKILNYDNENISTNITLKSEHQEKEKRNCNTANEVNLLGIMASNSKNIGEL